MDPASVYAFAKELSRRRIYRRDLLVPPPNFRAVGDFAGALFDEIVPLAFMNTCVDSSREEVVAAAWLARAIDCYGCAFEDIVEHSEFHVAHIVASVSADLRLLHPRRKIDLQSRMSTAGVTAQLITFCEIVVQMEKFKKYSIDALARIGSANLKMWIDEQVGLIGAMHGLRDLPALGPLLTTVRDALPKLSKRLSKCKTR